MSFLLFLKKHRPVSIVIDVGSSSVGSAIVSLNEASGPSVIWSDRQQFRIGERAVGTQLVTNLKQGLEKTLNAAEKYIRRESREPLSVERVMCSYCSPWHNSSTKSVHIVEETPAFITHSFVEDILKKEEARLMETLSKDNTEGTRLKEPILLDQKIIQIKLNGYTTNTPYDKKASEIDLTFFTTIASGVLIDIVETLVRKIIHNHKISHHAFNLVAWSVISDEFSHVKDFIHIDVTGEVTDITVVEDNSIYEVASLPAGRHLLIRTFIKRLNVNEEIAFSYLDLLARGAADTNLKKDLLAVIADVQNEFKILLDETIAQMTSKNSLPKTIFITADDDVAEIFSKSLQNVRPGAKIIILNNGNTPAHCKFEKERYTDNYIALESVFLHKLSPTS